MQKQAPSLGRILVMVGLRPVVLRPAAVPVAGLRRLDPAQAARATASRRLQGGDVAGHRGRRARSPACRWARSRRSSSTTRRAAPRPRSSSSRSTRRSRADTPGDPAPEDAAGGDLRRAHARERERPEAPGGRRRWRIGQVSPTVELDEIFRAFDEKTRQRVPDLDAAPGAGRRRAAARTSPTRFGNLPPFAEDTNKLLTGPRLAAGRRAAARAQHRRGLQRAVASATASCAA